MWIQEWIDERFGVPNTVNIQVYEDFAKEVRGRERKDIGLELELALSKVINKPNFNQYRLSEFITMVTHKLYKGQVLKGESNE